HPPEGAPPVPGDDETKAAAWITPQTTDVTGDEVPTIAAQPEDVTVVAPAPAEFSVEVAGVPAPDVKWQRQTGGEGDWEDVDGATGDTLTIDPTDVGMSGDVFRAVVSNRQGELESDSVTLTVTAA